MKKLVIAAFAVAFAAVAQAASINWGMTAIQNSPSGHTPAEGLIGYFFCTGDTSSQLTTVVMADVLASLANGDLTVLGSASYSKTGTSAMLTSSNNGSFAAGTTVSGFTVILDASTPNGAGYFVAGNEVTKTAAATGNLALSAGSMTVNGYQWAEIAPEPTSGLMMLLGMGVLALRRRRA